MCRYAGQEQDSRRYPGGPAAAANQELRQACQSVLRFAIKYNAVAQEAGAQLDALRGWQAVCEIAIALRFDPCGESVSHLYIFIFPTPFFPSFKKK